MPATAWMRASSARRPRGPRPMRPANQRATSCMEEGGAISTRRFATTRGWAGSVPASAASAIEPPKEWATIASTGPTARATAARLATPVGRSRVAPVEFPCAGRSKATTLKPASSRGCTKAAITAACPVQPCSRITQGGVPRSSLRAGSNRCAATEPQGKGTERGVPASSRAARDLTEAARWLPCLGRGGVQNRRKAMRPVRPGARDSPRRARGRMRRRSKFDMTLTPICSMLNEYVQW
ncbi:hypothetical protein BSY19_81 [Bosea sp. RAC05]|nr:hypothetical protein BSY19_81 [Bosea sp. RAC05]